MVTGGGRDLCHGYQSIAANPVYVKGQSQFLADHSWRQAGQHEQEGELSYLTVIAR